MSTIITAGMLVIGDEILSGRTKDKNIGFIADYLNKIGIDLKEVRIVADEQADIVEAVNVMRHRYTYVFTSGGIGPTHDDITADAIAAAFNLPCTFHPDAMKILEDHYSRSKLELTEARKRMARTPKGATLIENKVSKAPGFKIENVHVLAGVPKIMQAMMDALAPTLKSGTKMLSKTLDSSLGEGTIGGPLGIIQTNHVDTMIGSYPRFEEGNHTTQIVVRGREQSKINAAIKDVESMLQELNKSS